MLPQVPTVRSVFLASLAALALFAAGCSDSGTGSPAATASADMTGKLSRGAGLVYLPGGFGAGFVGQSADGCRFAGMCDLAVAKLSATVMAP